MQESKHQAVTQADFILFKQEMKNDYDLFQEKVVGKFELYLSQIDSKTEAMINKRVDKIGKWVIALVSVFIISFFTYFEYMHGSIEQINSERMSRIEEAVMASMNSRMIMGQDEIIDNKDSPTTEPTRQKKSRKR